MLDQMNLFSTNSVKEKSWKEKFEHYKAIGSGDILASGRVSITEFVSDREAILALMSEGIDDVVKLLEEIDVLHLRKNATFAVENDFLNLHHLELFLTLDDMNIRGIQILDIYHYADEYREALVYLIKTRDRGMIDFINWQSAIRIKNSLEQDGKAIKQFIAVVGGASLKHDNDLGFVANLFDDRCDLKMDILNYEEYLYGADSKESPQGADSKESPQQVKTDLNNDTTIEEGIRIAEGQGFRLLDKRDVGYGKFCILMYKDDTQDFLTSVSTENHFHYGECALNLARLKEHYHSDLPIVCCTSQPFRQEIDGKRYRGRCYHLTANGIYDSGFFKSYAELNQDIDLEKVKQYPVDWTKIRFSPFQGPSIPSYVFTSFSLERLEEIIGRDYAASLDMNSINICGVINYFIFMKLLSEKNKEWQIEAFDYMYTNRFSILLDYTAVSVIRLKHMVDCMRVSFAFCERFSYITKDEIDEYVKVLIEFCRNREKEEQKNSLFNKVLAKGNKPDYLSIDYWYPNEEAQKVVDLIFWGWTRIDLD